MSKKKQTKESIGPADYTTLDSMMTVKVNSNVMRLFSNAVAKDGTGNNNSIVLRKFILDYIKRNGNGQQDVFDIKE